MPIVEANGVQHNTHLLGDGPPAVMLHGLLVGNLASWFFTGAQALARTHRVLLYDLRGHGRSERTPTGYGVDSLRADLEALIAPRFSQPALLVGHSYGALVALSYALAHPERVSGLVLVEAPLPPSEQGELTDFLGRVPTEMVDALPGELQGVLKQRGRRANRLLASLRFLALESTLLSDVAAEPDIPDERLKELQCPVLCIYGRRSSCRPVGDRLGAVIPGAQVLELDGGHFLPLDAPAALSQAIVGFANG